MKEYKHPSIEDLRRLFKKVDKNKIEKIFIDLANKKFASPSIDEYFQLFEACYNEVFYGLDECESDCLTFRFQKRRLEENTFVSPKELTPEFPSGDFFS